MSQADETQPASGADTTNELLAVARSVWESREDLQRTYPQDGESWPYDYWFWLVTRGREEVPDLERLVPSTPPRHLMGRVFGEDATEVDFLRSGIHNAALFQRLLERHGVDFTGGGHLLDHGVGCGRILRFFALQAGRWHLVGTDVDADAIAWCRRHLTFAEFMTVDPTPPTELPSGTFDCAYSYSVFSHLPRERSEQWLRELRRLLRPGGVAVVTVQGQKVVDDILSGARAHPSPTPDALRDRLPELESEGFAFFPYRALQPALAENQRFFAEWDLMSYGSTIILEDHVRSHWNAILNVEAIYPAADDWQDHVVLRRNEIEPSDPAVDRIEPPYA